MASAARVRAFFQQRCLFNFYPHKCTRRIQGILLTPAEGPSRIGMTGIFDFVDKRTIFLTLLATENKYIKRLKIVIKESMGSE